MQEIKSILIDSGIDAEFVGREKTPFQFGEK